MKSIRLLLFLALTVYPVCMSAQYAKPPAPDPKDVRAPDPASHPKPIQYDTSAVLRPEVSNAPNAAISIADPNVPGISIIKRGAFFSVLNSSQDHVLALQVFSEYSEGAKIHVTSDSLDVPFEGVAPGEYFPAEAGGEGQLVGVSIDWIMFKDGRFYGSKKDADHLTMKARVRRKFFYDLLQSKNRELLVHETEECTKSAECLQKSGMNRSEWSELSKAIRSYRMNRSFRTASEYEVTLKRFIHSHDSFPAVRWIRSISTEKPADETDGWQFQTLIGSCNQNAAATQTGFITGVDGALEGPLTYNTSITSINAGIGSLSGPCRYTTYSNPNSKPGYVLSDEVDPGGDSYANGAFSTYANASCYNVFTNKSDYLDPKYSSGIGLTGNAFMYPRYRVESFIGTDQTVIWPGSALYMSVAFGYPEPYNPAANADGGTTYNYVLWSPPWSLYSNNNIFGTPNPVFPIGNGPSGNQVVLLADANSTGPKRSNGFGFMIANWEKQFTCAGGRHTFFLSKGVDVYANVYDESPVNVLQQLPKQAVTPLIYNPGVMGLQYKHYPPKQQASNAPACDVTDYCCCIASSGDSDNCAQTAEDFQEEEISCSSVGAATTQVLSSGQVPAVATSAGQTQSGDSLTGIGIARNGNSYLLDQLGLNSFIDGATLFINPGFTPPGGTQAGDIPVSGDWTGIGQSCLGYFRPSTGTWWLDKNCNGTFDAGTNEGPFQFGGLIDSNGYPVDVPVVGDWIGSGKTCIGIFRNGLWLMDYDCNGSFQAGNDGQVAFGGLVGDVPVVGYWNPTPAGYPHIPQLGVVRCYQPFPAPNDYCFGYPYYWVRDAAGTNDGNQAHHVVMDAFPYGGQGSAPAAHYNNASHASLYALYNGVWPQAAGDMYVTGDWLGTGVTYPGIYRQGGWIEDLTGAHTYDTLYFFGGLPGLYGGLWQDFPLVGKW